MKQHSVTYAYPNCDKHLNYTHTYILQMAMLKIMAQTTANEIKETKHIQAYIPMHTGKNGKNNDKKRVIKSH